VQRVIVDERVEADFLDALVPKVEAIAMRDPADDATRLGALISESEAIRVESAIQVAGQSGAKVLTGGDAGRTLVDLVLVRIFSRPDTPIVIPSQLVVRESTGPVGSGASH
jgi:glyceraldehyde-3-phosphate dehydrogenase (NADP+)